MPTTEVKIWNALKARLSTLALNPVHPVAWPNESFNTPENGYLRVNHIPNINNRLFLKGADPHQRLSILQIDVFEKINEDASVAIELAGLVAAHFPADLKMMFQGVGARVTRAPEVAQSIPDGSHLLTPVTIPIEVFA
jgi:hypothetical protein